MLTPTEIEKFRNQIQGTIILPNDSGYQKSKTLYNAMIDKRPAIFVKCKSKNDVAKAIHFAKTNGLEVSVKAGGHNGAGLALVDGGLVIDLSDLKGITINKDEKTAIVEPGNTLSEVDKATHEYGFAIPVGVNGNTGISGLTLGGGLGFLTRKLGLTIDHLLEAEVVLANGNIVIANKNTNPDLFWALRGGGGNFGVVVSFTFNLTAITSVYAGPMFWPMEKAKDVMKFYDEITKNASHDLYGFFAFLNVPGAEPFPEHLHNKNVCGIVWSYTGNRDKIDEVFKPIREFGSPILDFVSEMPLPTLNSLFDPLYPPGLQWYWKGHYVNELTEGCIDENIKFGSNLPTPQSTMHLYPIDGKAHGISRHQTAWSHRDIRWVQAIVGVSPDPEKADAIKNWAKSYYDAVAPFSSGGGYVNFTMHDDEKRVKESYGINYERLREIKKKFDPENVFHLNQNIKPAD